ncbi:MAG: dienelactone hydrolase family protein [Polyangiales bacterium]
MTITHETLSLEVADGTTMSVFVARPADHHDHHAGVMLFQEIWGVNAHIRSVADRLARLGFTVAAPDVFHRTAPDFDVPYDDFSGRDHAAKLTPEGVLADLTTTHTFLVDHLSQTVDDPKVAAVGFCLGGRLAFVANAAFPLAAAACFYGGGIATTQLERAADQHGPLALFWGGKDAHITVEHRRAVADALSGAGKTFVEVCFGHADHGYFCDLRKSHDAHAAKESWALLTAFLEHHLVDEA